MDFTWYERQMRVQHKIRYILVLHLVFRAKKIFSALARENFRTHNNTLAHAKEKKKQTDRQRRSKKQRVERTMEASSRALSFSSKSRFSVSKSATALTQRRTRTTGELDDNYHHHHHHHHHHRHHLRRESRSHRRNSASCSSSRNNSYDDSCSSTRPRNRRRPRGHRGENTTEEKEEKYRRRRRLQSFSSNSFFESASSSSSSSSNTNNNAHNNNNSNNNSNNNNNSKERELSSSSLWWRCAKLPMYSVAIIPVLVAASSASYLNLIDPKIGASAMNLTLRLLLGACSVIAWLNISNDAWDYQTGVDSGNRKPESIVNLLNGDVKAAHVTSAFFLIAGVVTLLPLFANAPAVAPMALLLAIGCGYAYQAPPLRLSYKGLGEPLCFTAFGPLATSAFFAVFAGANLPSFLNVPPLLWVNAWMVGVTTSMILFASHLHQREGDEVSGKLSPCVRFGVDFCVSSIQHVVSAYYALIATFVSCGWLPSVAGAMIFITYPLARAMQNYALDNVENEKMLFKTKYFAVRWHVAHGVALAFGLWLSRRLAVPF